MVPVSLLSSAPHARRRRTPQQLSDNRLDALAKAWTAQDRARLKAQRTTTPRVSRNRIWQRIQEEFAQLAMTRALANASD